MSDLIEIVLTTDASGALWSCCAWDPQTGTHLLTYKGKLHSKTTQARYHIHFVSFRVAQVVELCRLMHWTTSTMSSS